MPPLLLVRLLLIVAVVEAGVGHHHPMAPATPPWPEQYHAVVITNQTSLGDRPQQIDIYYDWPRGGALNVIRGQLDSGESPLWDVEWSNGSSFVFDAASWTAFQYTVGLLHGFDCHVWSNFVFDRYYEDAATGSPVSWIVVNGTGMQRHVVSFNGGSADGGAAASP